MRDEAIAAAVEYLGLPLGTTDDGILAALDVAVRSSERRYDARLATLINALSGTDEFLDRCHEHAMIRIQVRSALPRRLDGML